jgi:hypothetical protein
MFDSGTMGADLPFDAFLSAINGTLQAWVEDENASALLEELINIALNATQGNVFC